MILLTGTSTTSVPFEVTVLVPQIFETREEASNAARDTFISILKTKAACEDECLTDGWETGVTLVSKESAGGITYKAYAEKEKGAILYHLRSDSLHIVYRSDNVEVVDGKPQITATNALSAVTGPSALYWNITPHPAVRIALAMALVSGYATARVSTGAELPTTYEEVTAIVPEDDPVTTLLIVYAMLKADDRYTYFHIQDGTLFLYSDRGFVSLDENVQGFEDGSMCDPARLYAFSPMYRDIPDTIDGAVQVFRGKFKAGPTVTITLDPPSNDSEDKVPPEQIEILESERQFRNLLLESFSPGLNWRDNVIKMLSLLDIDAQDVDSAAYTLMRIVAKHKLRKGANVIFSQFPCSVPTRDSP